MTESKRTELRGVWDSLVIGDVIETNLLVVGTITVITATVCFRGEDALLAREHGNGDADRWVGFDARDGAVLRVIRKQACEFCGGPSVAHVEDKFICTGCYQKKTMKCGFCEREAFFTGDVVEVAFDTTISRLGGGPSQGRFESVPGVEDRIDFNLFEGKPICTRCIPHQLTGCELCKKVKSTSDMPIVVGRRRMVPCVNCFEAYRENGNIIACQRCQGHYTLVCAENLWPAEDGALTSEPQHVCHGCKKPSFKQKTGGPTAVVSITQRLTADKPLMRAKASHCAQVVGYPEIEMRQLRVPLVVVPTESARSIYCSEDITRFVVKHLMQQGVGDDDSPTLGQVMLAGKVYGVCRSSRAGSNTLKIPHRVIRADPTGVVAFVELVGMAE